MAALARGLRVRANDAIVAVRIRVLRGRVGAPQRKRLELEGSNEDSGRGMYPSREDIQGQKGRTRRTRTEGRLEPQMITSQCLYRERHQCFRPRLRSNLGQAGVSDFTRTCSCKLCRSHANHRTSSEFRPVRLHLACVNYRPSNYHPSIELARFGLSGRRDWRQ